MITETETRITETVIDYEAELVVRHNDDYTHGFHLSCGCVNEWMTEGEVRALVKLLNAGLRKYKAVTKPTKTQKESL